MLQILLISAISGRMFFYQQNLGIISHFLDDMKHDYIQEFDRYRRDYNRTYKDVYMTIDRYYIFEKNLYKIEQHTRDIQAIS